jgi:hypothetical protein
MTYRDFGTRADSQFGGVFSAQIRLEGLAQVADMTRSSAAQGVKMSRNPPRVGLVVNNQVDLVLSREGTGTGFDSFF